MHHTVDPARTLMDLATAYWASRCLHVVAELGVADALGDEPQSATELARQSGVQPQLLQRLLRSLSNHGIFQDDGERFAHNAASRLLRTDAAPSLRSLARMMGLPVHWDAYRELESALRTGEPSIAKVTEGGLFAHLRKHPEEARIFHEAMVGKSLLQVAPIVEAYDFRGFKSIGDIGGGLGHLLYAVLERAPASHGILFDLPGVIAQAREHTHPRVSYVGGDFFKDPIPACDLYLMMTVLHDWSDRESVDILNNLKARAPRGAKLLILEGVVQSKARNDLLIDIDIEMLVMTSGHERSEREWRSVVSSAGMQLSRIIATGSFTSILEVQVV